MTRFFFILTALLLPVLASAQQISFFPTFAAYEDYVDGQVMSRDYIPLVKRLGGGDEITDEQLGNLQRQFDFIYQEDFENVAILKTVTLENGFEQEARAYWTDLTGYLFYYALLHRREDGVVVIEFVLNSSVKAIMARF